MLRRLPSQSQFLEFFSDISVCDINLAFPIQIFEYERKQ